MYEIVYQHNHSASDYVNLRNINYYPLEIREDIREGFLSREKEAESVVIMIRPLYQDIMHIGNKQKHYAFLREAMKEFLKQKKYPIIKQYMGKIGTDWAENILAWYVVKHPKTGKKFQIIMSPSVSEDQKKNPEQYWSYHPSNAKNTNKHEQLGLLHNEQPPVTMNIEEILNESMNAIPLTITSRKNNQQQTIETTETEEEKLPIKTYDGQDMYYAGEGIAVIINTIYPPVILEIMDFVKFVKEKITKQFIETRNNKDMSTANITGQNRKKKKRKTLKVKTIETTNTTIKQGQGENNKNITTPLLNNKKQKNNPLGKEPMHKINEKNIIKRGRKRIYYILTPLIPYVTILTTIVVLIIIST